MLLLLPPSEGKTPPDDGPPVDLQSLIYPELAGARQRVLTRLAKVSAQRNAARVLGVGDSLSQEVAANTQLLAAPSAPAAEVYTGVLFAAAGLSELNGEPARRAAEHVRIFSGLWGALSPADHIPAYRLSMGVALPGLPKPRAAAAGPVKLATYWKQHLAGVLDRGEPGVIVDCRSAAYAAAWKPPAGGATYASVQVVRERNGSRTVVSHNAKHARGLLTRHLLTRAGDMPRSAEELATASEEMCADPQMPVHGVELHDGPASRHTLTLIERG
ncbi:YaaA family protein [Bogoriella caseilytica]|uniref:Peroxide stress protein YaaA n=1 Tax=Bogoriella caseilytica TaxID=56055 RepID=A0A3N2BG00_9MICO|nr:peroxide stress protein YaaA [Bogoriella caseilytica]ROR74182.1 hypothetical protein EDD31_2582 [Bogoriella caseilytica]